MSFESWLGARLRRRRAGEERSTWRLPTLQAPETITVTSDSFAPGGTIPERHRGPGAGDNLSPALAWSGLPEGTAQLLLIIEDTDVPLPRPIIHTVALIDPGATGLGAGELAATTPGVRPLTASFGRTGYAGPRPLAGHGPHHYGFQLFALDTALEVPNAHAAFTAAAGHVLARGRLVGVDER